MVTPKIENSAIVPLRLAELFYVLDEEDGIISQQRAAQLLAVSPGCGEARRGSRRTWEKSSPVRDSHWDLSIVQIYWLYYHCY